MRELRIARGKRRTHPYLKSGKASWPKLVEKLLDFKVTGETFAEYMAMPADRQAEIKDVGYLVGGPFLGTTRKKSELLHRSIITLDIDHVDAVDKVIEAYDGFEFVLHSTHKHSDDNPRLRLVFPLTRDVEPYEYESVARNVAAWSEMDWFDDTTFEVSRIMYWPSRSSDGDVVAEHHEGSWVDPDDWEPDQDFMDWPRSSRVTELRRSDVEAQDPLTKAGWIGAFCRTYDIHGAISTYLPDTFEATQWDNRYSPVGATGPAGAIVYDDVFIYSHHENPEPISQKNLNAFDLVRLLRFGEETDDPDVNMTQRDSYKAMADLCAQDPAVVAQLDELSDAVDELPPAEVRKTVDDFMREIQDMRLRTAHDCDALLPRIAGYNDSEAEQLLQVLKEKYPHRQSIVALRREIGRIRKQLSGRNTDDEIADIERELIEEMLNEHFEGGAHIRRIGKAFWIYEGGVWRMVGDEMVKGLLHDSIIRLREERPEEAAQLVAAIGENKTSALVGSLFSMMTARLARRSEMGQKDPLMLRRRITEPVVNCLNCELHLDYQGNLMVKDHDPAHFYTLQVNTAYDPDAECPEWDRFCAMVFSEAGDPEDMQRHLEELGGYVISMAKWLKNWVLFHGPTNTGKSTVLDVFKELLGDACLAMELGRFGINNAFADSSLLGKLLLADDDFDKSAHLPDGFIKKISEEKLITSDVKFASPITFTARVVPLVCANHWPVTRDVSDAFRERALVFHFDHRIAGSERSDARRDQMLEELPGILNRFIAGLVRLRQRGEWDIPVDAAIAHETWESQSNQAIRYLREQLVRAPGEFVRASHIWADYRRWAPGKGAPLGQHELYQRLDQLIGLRVKRSGYDGWSGYELAAIDVELGISGDEDLGV